MAEIGNPYRNHVANVTGDVPPYFSNTLKDKISCNTGLVVIKLMSTSFSYSKIIQSEVFIYIYTVLRLAVLRVQSNNKNKYPT
jgi:hypothetical protein